MPKNGILCHHLICSCCCHYRCQNQVDPYSRFDRLLACDSHPHRQAGDDSIYRASIASRGKNGMRVDTKVGRDIQQSVGCRSSLSLHAETTAHFLYLLFIVFDHGGGGGGGLGSVVCDAWLSLDYTVSNASVANLLLISFDRFMCVTRPLKYRVRRTPHCAVPRP